MCGEVRGGLAFAGAYHWFEHNLSICQIINVGRSAGRHSAPQLYGWMHVMAVSDPPLISAACAGSTLFVRWGWAAIGWPAVLRPLPLVCEQGGRRSSGPSRGDPLCPLRPPPLGLLSPYLGSGLLKLHA